MGHPSLVELKTRGRKAPSLELLLLFRFLFLFTSLAFISHGSVSFPFFISGRTLRRTHWHRYYTANEPASGFYYPPIRAALLRQNYFFLDEWRL
ncbi:MAG: hypothetical protein A2Y02_02700 [Omnitrophica bacterium GWA2_52_12]|nr:MAG: hypothetical protein A2Y02_02700 [Omnitrophica bacterium GWA2_52_12]